jgi:hypothetical protein
MPTNSPSEKLPADVACVRCGRTAKPLPWGLPEGWEGTPSEAICPGCQYAEWHPHCTSLVSYRDGERVDPEVDWANMPREEWDFESLMRCDYIDLGVSWIDDADWPKEWRCPKCGGTDFEGVHRDYPPSGLQPGSFEVDISDPDDLK